MKIDKIDTVSFGNTKQKALKTTSKAAIAIATGITADNFVKGLSKPNALIDAYISSNSSHNAVDASSPYDEACNCISTSYCDDDYVEALDYSTSPSDYMDEYFETCVTDYLDCSYEN